MDGTMRPKGPDDMPDWVRHGIFWQVHPPGFCGADIRPSGPARFHGRGLEALVPWPDYAVDLQRGHPRRLCGHRAPLHHGFAHAVRAVEVHPTRSGDGQPLRTGLEPHTPQRVPRRLHAADVRGQPRRDAHRLADRTEQGPSGRGWYAPATERVALDNRRYTYRSISEDGAHAITVALDLNGRPSFTVADADGAVLHHG